MSHTSSDPALLCLNLPTPTYVLSASRRASFLWHVLLMLVIYCVPPAPLVILSFSSSPAAPPCIEPLGGWRIRIKSPRYVFRPSTVPRRAMKP